MQTSSIPLPRLYGADAQTRICRIEGKVGYDLITNGLSTADIEIEDLSRCEQVPLAMQFFELFDTPGSLGMFRVNSIETMPGNIHSAKYYLQHAIATLGDVVIDGYLELGGTGVATADVITTLLAKQQTVLWALGECDFSYEEQYSFENDSILTALFSLPASFTEEYEWTFDFSTFPFTLNLILMQDGDETELRFNRNMKGVTITTDCENLCTRIYPKGYGEGNNQLTIASVNGGSYYIDADTQGTYGIIERVWADTTFTDAAALKSTAEAVLERLKEPVVTVEIEAYDLYEMSGEALDAFHLGRLVRAPLPVYSTTVRERVVGISKRDVYGKNEDATLTLRNRNTDVTDDMAELTRKATIGELYSQGATNMYAEHYADNADDSHPLEMKFFIDEACVHINAVMLRYDLANFRSYSAGAEAGGSSTPTSSSSGASTPTSSSGGSTTRTSSTSDSAINASNAGSYLATGQPIIAGSDHYHTITIGQTYHTHTDDGHSHTVYIPSHTHTVSISAHTHTVTIPSHTHAVIHGIYEGGIASSVSVTVDGTAVPSEDASTEMNIVDYLTKDGDGLITRNTWHSVVITPDTLTRIVADIFVKTFIRSIGGGTY